MSDSSLTRHAGPIALVAGTLFAAVDLARLPIRLAPLGLAVAALGGWLIRAGRSVPAMS